MVSGRDAPLDEALEGAQSSGAGQPRRRHCWLDKFWALDIRLAFGDFYEGCRGLQPFQQIATPRFPPKVLIRP
jgi:hypothetical protein